MPLISAFQNPETKEIYTENMELFNSYARGGIEYLYEHLITRDRDEETDLFDDERLNNIIAVLSGPMSDSAL